MIPTIIAHVTSVASLECFLTGAPLLGGRQLDHVPALALSSLAIPCVHTPSAGVLWLSLVVAREGVPVIGRSLSSLVRTVLSRAQLTMKLLRMPLDKARQHEEEHCDSPRQLRQVLLSSLLPALPGFSTKLRTMIFNYSASSSPSLEPQ
jgi:hypothetical protein